MATSSAGPKNALMVEITKFRTRMATTLAPSAMNSAQPDRPTEVGRDHDPPRIAPLHEDAGQGAEDDGRDEEREDQRALAVFEPVAPTTTAMSAASTMLLAS